MSQFDPSTAADRARQLITRRHFFGQCGVGVGKMALASLLCSAAQSLGQSTQPTTRGASNPLAPRAPHFPAKAKRVIYMFMGGAPSQLDLFDYKPQLVKYDGQPIPSEYVKDQRYAFIEKSAALMSPRYKFAKYGQSGQELSEMLPHLATVADDICIIRSMHTDQFNHAPAQIFLNTGSAQLGRPCMGSWVSYGLGSAAENLPAFVVLTSGKGTSGGPANWGCGFLPTVYQGVNLRGQGEPILSVSNPRGIDAHMQRDSLDLIRGLNQERFHVVGDPEIETRINAYELAYKMQSSAPELTDLSSESKATLEMYGIKPDGSASFAKNCLLARRLIERGVRFVNLYHEAWDHHTDVAGGLKTECGNTDRPAAALVQDLKQRGLLDDTLVIWGGEFGRTPMVETNPAIGRSMGRDHHPVAYSMWMAGGGVKPGTTVGATDDLGFHIAEDPVHVHDLQATILYLLGLDHKRLTYHYQGRDFRLTDVHGEVVRKILA
jgi:uncharacterized protein (DUF1501 family)